MTPKKVIYKLDNIETDLPECFPSVYIKNSTISKIRHAIQLLKWVKYLNRFLTQNNTQVATEHKTLNIISHQGNTKLQYTSTSLFNLGY